VTDHFLTGSRGHVLPDLFERNVGQGEATLDRVVASVGAGTTDRAGRLLGAFNIRYVVLERSAGVHRWLNQRDLALVRDQPGYILLKNESELRRAAFYNEVPSAVQRIEEHVPATISASGEIERVIARQESASRYSSESVSGPGVVFLAETHHEGWRAAIAGWALDGIEGSWGNAFRVADAAEGPLEISYPRDGGDVAWLIVVPLAWIVAVGAAFSRRRAPLSEEA
jgi:hypothetical protein